MNAPFIDIHTHRSLSEEAFIVSCGIHPWWLDDEKYDWENDLNKLEAFLEENRLAAIGEAGIDRNHRSTISLQTMLLERQILLSERYQKPLIIHISVSDKRSIIIRNYRITVL